MPALVALATDPQRDVADGSLRLLHRQVPCPKTQPGCLFSCDGMRFF